MPPLSLVTLSVMLMSHSAERIRFLQYQKLGRVPVEAVEEILGITRSQEDLLIIPL